MLVAGLAHRDLKGHKEKRELPANLEHPELKETKENPVTGEHLDQREKKEKLVTKVDLDHEALLDLRVQKEMLAHLDFPDHQVNKDQLALRVNLAILVSMGKKETEVSLVIPVLLEILDYKDSQGNLVLPDHLENKAVPGYQGQRETLVPLDPPVCKEHLVIRVLQAPRDPQD